MTPQSLHRSAVDLLTDWWTPDTDQNSLRHTYLAFLEATPQACLRQSAAGHLTASTILFDADHSHVLLTLHPRVGRWVQLGGHCEPEDASLADAALREAREESGIDDIELPVGIVRLNTHPITCSLGVPTRHLDVQFAGVASSVDGGELPAIVRSAESVDLAWWPTYQLPRDADRATLEPLIDAALEELDSTL